MKNTFKIICTLALLVIVSSCSSIKVLDAWKSETASSIKDNNILVIARTQDKQARIAFEQKMAEQMRANGIKATESFRKFPNLLPDEKLSEEKMNNFKAFLENEGFDGITVTAGEKKVFDVSKSIGWLTLNNNHEAYVRAYDQNTGKQKGIFGTKANSTIQLPAGSYKLKFSNFEIKDVLIEAGQKLVMELE